MQLTPSDKKTKRYSGGTVLAEQLALLGTRRIFTIPGETFISVLDGLYDRAEIQPVVCRHEGGAAMMAEASAKLTGKPGVVFVTRAPGLANAISGLAVARHDHTPLVLLVGLPSTHVENRGDLQAEEFHGMMSALTKWTTVVRDPQHIPATLARAFHRAQSGRPGPVAIGFPENCLNAPSLPAFVRPHKHAQQAPTSKQLNDIASVLNAAKRPLLLVGGGPWSKKTQKRAEKFAERLDMPVAAAFRCQDFFDNRHKCYVGHAGIAMDAALADSIGRADVVVALGANLGDVTTEGYSLIKSPQPDQVLIHIMPGSEDLSKACRADIAIAASPVEAAKALSKLKPAVDTTKWRTWRRDLRRAYKASRKPVPTPGRVNMERIVRMLSKQLPSTAIITNGAGNYTQFVHRYFTYKGFRSCLAPIAGSMGYGIPAAISAKLEHPKRTVVAFAGDGCFMMSVQELATAVQYGANIIVIIANNGMLGTIRMHQEKRFPKRVIATTLTNPDFVALAESLGAHGERVTRTAEFEPAFKRALNMNKPAVIDLVLDPQAIAPEEILANCTAQ